MCMDTPVSTLVFVYLKLFRGLSCLLLDVCRAWEELQERSAGKDRVRRPGDKLQDHGLHW